MAWIRRTAVNLGINTETNISVDNILLMMYQVHQDSADLNYVT